MTEFILAAIFLWLLPMLIIWAMIKIVCQFESLKNKDYKFFFSTSIIPCLNLLFIIAFIIVIMEESNMYEKLYNWLSK